MNLFELNARLAVKLGQSLDTLYELEYLEYSLLFNIIKKDIQEKSDSLAAEASSLPQPQVRVNLPDDLKIK